MKAADRKMSKSDIDRARENFERLQTRTAKRVLEFHDSRRHAGEAASRPILPDSTANLKAPASVDLQAPPPRS
jgi:hypothetical protein